MKLNVVVLMAGRGERFSDAGYARPKWAILEERSGLSLLALSVLGLGQAVPDEACWAFVAQQADLERASLSDALSGTAVKTDDARVIGLDKVHGGPLATFLEALPDLGLNVGAPLLFQVCDTYLPVTETDIVLGSGLDGCVYCFGHDAPNLCHVAVGRQGEATRLYEKVGPMLGLASSGAFLFRSVGDFLDHASKVLSAAPPHCRGEHYISDVVNRMLLSGRRFAVSIIPMATAVGTPDELRRFSKSTVASAA